MCGEYRKIALKMQRSRTSLRLNLDYNQPAFAILRAGPETCTTQCLDFEIDASRLGKGPVAHFLPHRTEGPVSRC